jgi:chaperonin GroES
MAVELMEIEDDEVEGQAAPEARNPLDVLQSFIQPGVVNLVSMLPQETVDKIGTEVVRGYDIDKASRSDWEKQTKTAMELALQVSTEKSWPWPKAANVKYPLITTAAIQFSARAYPAIVKGQEVVKGEVLGPDPGGQKKERADRIGRHMSYQVLEEIEDWDEEVDKLLMRMSIVGCEFRKTYFDKALARNCSDLVEAKFVVYNHKVPFRKLRRLTHLLFMFKNEVIERQRGGLWADIGELGLPDGEDNDEDGHFEFLEQYCWYDLDEDGYKEPYIVTVKKDSGKVVRILPNFEGVLVRPGDPGTKRGVHVNANGEISKIDQVDYWTKFGFMPNPDGGSYDLGLGILLNPINETVNTVLNQMLDAGTRANTGGGFIGSGLKMKAGPVKFAPGEYKPVDVSGGKIADNIYHLESPGPSPVLFNLLGMLIEAGKDISSVKDILTGDQQVNQTATTTLALIEQGQKVFSAIYKRVHRSLKQEFKKLYRLNKLYLQPEDYYRFQDEVEPIYLEDYQGDDTDVAPVSDPTLVSDAQELTRSEALMQFVGDPFINQRELRVKRLQALKVQDIETLLDTSQNPPPPMDPAQAQKAMQEIEAKGQEVAQQEQAIGEQIQQAQAEMERREQALQQEIQRADQALAAKAQELEAAEQAIQAEMDKLAAAQRELALNEQIAVQTIEIEAERNEMQAEVLAAELNEQAATKEAEIARAESDALESVRASQKPQESAE